MKNVIIKTLAVMLTVWYSMSVIGFDVHTCSDSGRSFVVTFIEGMTCGEIHPDDSCDAASCHGNHESCGCHHTEGFSFRAKSCCSNDYQALALTGTVTAQSHDHFDECGCGHCPCVGFAVCEIPAANIANSTTAYIQGPESGAGTACERQASLHVWRI